MKYVVTAILMFSISITLSAQQPANSPAAVTKPSTDAAAVKPEAKALAKPTAAFVKAYPRYIILSEMIVEKQSEPTIAAYLQLVKEQGALESLMLKEMDSECLKVTGQTGCRYDVANGTFVTPKAPDPKPAENK